MFSWVCTGFGSIKTVGPLNLYVFLIFFIALISSFHSVHSFDFHSSFFCLISDCLSPCDKLNSTPLLNLTFEWNGVSKGHTKSNETQQNIKCKTILLWFIAHGHSNLYYACPDCSLATTRPCFQGEFVPRGLCCCVKLDSSYQVSNVAEIFSVNQQGALEKQLDPGR